MISAFERRWVLWFAGVVMTITTLPYLLGYAAQGMDYYFTGFIFGVEDGNSYIAKMLSGTFSAWLFRSPYTASPQQGMLIYLPYILLGKMAAPPGLHEQLVALYHLYRIVAGFLVIIATYHFLAFFLKDTWVRRFGLLLIILGGGLGWLLVISGSNYWWGSLPLDFYSPETFCFLSLYGLPHLALARALLLGTLLAYLKGVTSILYPDSELVLSRTLMLRSALNVSILWLFTGLAQPLDAVVIGIVIMWHQVGLAAWIILRHTQGSSTDLSSYWQLVKFVILSGILPGLFVMYNLWTSFHDPFVATWMGQNVLKSPHPLHYLLAYGLILPYAYLGGRRLLHHQPFKGWLLVSWIIILPLLVYLPVNLQRRLSDGVWVALVTLAMLTLEGLSSRNVPRRDWKRFLSTTPLFLLFPTTLFLIAGGIKAALWVKEPHFRPYDEVAVFQYIQAKSDPGVVVLASYKTGNTLPAWAPVRVLIGHGPESAFLPELQAKVAAFFSETTPDQQRIDLIHQYEVGYVFYGPTERALGKWNPERAGYLEPVYQSSAYVLFRVLP